MCLCVWVCVSSVCLCVCVWVTVCVDAKFYWKCVCVTVCVTSSSCGGETIIKRGAVSRIIYNYKKTTREHIRGKCHEHWLAKNYKKDDIYIHNMNMHAYIIYYTIHIHSVTGRRHVQVYARYCGGPTYSEKITLIWNFERPLHHHSIRKGVFIIRRGAQLHDLMYPTYSEKSPICILKNDTHNSMLYSRVDSI